MDADQTRIEADLRGVLDGEVYCNPLHTQMYASDASLYEITPLAVVRPRHEDDVAQCVRYASENSLPLVPRGGGTGHAGQAIGPGIVIDFSRFMRRLIHLDAGGQTVRVQPGMPLAELNRVLAKHRLVFGADPATRSVTTIGSVVAIDSLGSHFLQYGTAGESLIESSAVLADGTKARLVRQRWTRPNTGSPQLDAITSSLGNWLWENRVAIKDPPWRGVARGCGYRLDCFDHDSVDLARIQSGAEGTLATLTELRLRVQPMPEARGVVLLFFERLELAVKAAAEARRDKVAACDLMDRRLIEIARDIDSRYESLLPRGAEALLLIEHQGADAIEVRNKLNSLSNRIMRRAPNTLMSRIILDDNERDFIWKLSRRVIPRLYRIRGTARPVPFVEDLAVPPDRLPEFVLDIQNTLKSERVTGALFAHAAHGSLHLRPFLDPNSPDDVARMQRIADRLVEKVIEYRGVISGEHAVGLSRSSYLRQQLGDHYSIHRRVKEIFDPSGILNPGKLITDSAQKVTDNLRVSSHKTVVSGEAGAYGSAGSGPSAAGLNGSGSNGSVSHGAGNGMPGSGISAGDAPEREASGRRVGAGAGSLVNLFGKGKNAGKGAVLSAGDSRRTHSPALSLPILAWSEPQSLQGVAEGCNGCGRCRSTAPNERMCPMFRATRAEESSPRSKANIMRGLLSGAIPPALVETDELRAIADLCFHCHQCRIECPASVDIPKLVLELKAQYTATNGLRLSDRLLSRLDILSAIASKTPGMANWALENKFARWLLEKSTGIAQGRRLPGFAKQPFMRWAVKNRLVRPSRAGGRKILYLVDHYANWNNPTLAMSLVAVMQHQNVEVYVPTWQTVTWMTRIAMGDIEKVRKLIAPQIRQLAEAVRQGYEIVSTEPTAILCLKNEYVSILDSDDARLVAEHAWEAGQYLWHLHQQNQLELNFKPLSTSVLYHTPCHLKAVDSEYSGQRLLDLIPGVTVQNADAGCSGMAGTYGMRRQTYRKSLRVGWNLISTMQDTHAQLGSTECAACKLQMEQGTDKPTVHPIALMAYAYGKMPEVKNWIQRRNEGLTVL